MTLPEVYFTSVGGEQHLTPAALALFFEVPAQAVQAEFERQIPGRARNRAHTVEVPPEWVVRARRNLRRAAAATGTHDIRAVVEFLAREAGR